MLRRVLLAGLTALTLLPATAGAIPAYARRYKVSCQLCHNPVPKLTDFGRTFAGNGYRMAADEPPRDTINTGDPLLALQKDLPLAMRLEAYAQAYSKGNVATDFATPYLIKLLASGPISKKFSYFMYINLLERGQFGGFEDAFLFYNDIAGKPVDLLVGQFQVSDPMFKRESRLMFEDYALYLMKVGAEPANLTYDRGLLMNADVAGFAFTGELLNGNGIDNAPDNRTYDDNGFKNLAGYLSRDFGQSLRLAAFGYYGRSDSEGEQNKVVMFGGDGTLELGIVEFNAQYLHREDTNPLFLSNGSIVKTDGGLAELIIRPRSGRWHGFGLYNDLRATDPVLSVEFGPEATNRYQTLTGGLGYLVVRNLKVTGEMRWDFQEDEMRWTLGFVTAF
jgi:hypothetical protein